MNPNIQFNSLFSYCIFTLISLFFIILPGIAITIEIIAFNGYILETFVFVLGMLVILSLGIVLYNYNKKPHKILRYYFRYKKIFTSHKINSVHDIYHATNGAFGDVDIIKSELRLLMSQGLVSGIKTHRITPFEKIEVKEWEF